MFSRKRKEIARIKGEPPKYLHYPMENEESLVVTVQFKAILEEILEKLRLL